jgi:ATP adenylyltransferase
MEFVEGPRANECALCSIAKADGGSADAKKFLVIEKLKSSYLVLNKYPYSNGHLMICPIRHESDWTKLTEAELSEISFLNQKALRALTKAFRPEGFNMGVNLGKAAGAGIADHVHQHIVPRWLGDVNFLPLFSEVKVISEHLEKTYDRILKAWGEI